MSLESLITKYAPLYQDVETNKQTVKGVCPVDCLTRWKQIKPFIPKAGVVLEIGADCGYFTAKIAEAYPNTLVWAFEISDRWKIAKELFEQKKLYNVVLCNWELTPRDLFCLTHNVEAVDLVLALSVFHHFLPGHTRQAIKWLSQMWPRLIVEYPVKTEHGNKFPDLSYETMQDQYSNLHYLFNNYNKKKTIAENRIDANETRRICYLEKKRIERDNLCSWFTRDLEDPQRPLNNKLIYERNQWALYRKAEANSLFYELAQKPWVPGILLYNALQFNVQWPPKKWIEAQVENKYKELIEAGENVTEIGLRNCVFTAQGIEVIDWEHDHPYYSKDIAFQEVKKTFKELNDITSSLH